MVYDKNMLPSKYSLKSYAVALKNIDVFKHLKHLNEPKAVLNSSWQSYCSDSGNNFQKLQKLDRFYYYPQVYYAVGGSGCKNNLEEPKNQTFVSFSLRNMIIQGRTIDERIILSYKKNAIYLIFALLPTYLLLVGLIYCILTNQKKESTLEEKKKNAALNEKKKQ